MITLIEALNYRCLQYVQRLLNPFHVLVGPNASGKTTFLDVIGFLRDLVSEGLDTALSARARMGQICHGLSLVCVIKIRNDIAPGSRTCRPLCPIW